MTARRLNRCQARADRSPPRPRRRHTATATLHTSPGHLLMWKYVIYMRYPIITLSSFGRGFKETDKYYTDTYKSSNTTTPINSVNNVCVGMFMGFLYVIVNLLN